MCSNNGFLHRWLKQSGGVEEVPVINFMCSATPEPQERTETLQTPELAMVQYNEAHRQEDVEIAEEGGYRLTFNTSSVCFGGTNAQASSLFTKMV